MEIDQCNIFYGHFTHSTESRRTVVKYGHLVLGNSLSLPRNSVVKLTDHPNMTVQWT